MRSAVSLLITAAAVLAFAAPAGAHLGRVVALGDSSATGTGLGADLPGTPDLCNRTAQGYPALAMQQVSHSQFINETCDGATTSALFNGWSELGIPRQLDALNGSERAVILSIGDNNAGFGEVTSYCVTQPADGACASKYVVGDVNTLIAKAGAIASSTTPPSIGAAIDAIHSAAPNAKVFLVGYLRLAPPDGVGCKPNYLNLSTGDGPVFAAWEDTVNQTLSSVAAAHNAYFVDMQSASAAHNACTPAGTRWVVPLGSAAPGEGLALHPNAAGAQAIAGALVSAMSTAGLDLGPDTTDPVVTISSPQAGAVLTSDHVAVQFSASDDDTVASCDRNSGEQVALTEGQNTITVTCADVSGNSASASVTVTYEPPPEPTPPTPEVTPPTAVVTAPPSAIAPPAALPPAALTISDVKPSVLRRATRDADFIRETSARGGAHFNVELAAESFVWLRLERSTQGRKKGRRCVKPARKNRKAGRCSRWISASDGYLTLLPAGASTLQLTGRNDGRPLRAGKYRVRASLDGSLERPLLGTPFRVRITGRK